MFRIALKTSSDRTLESCRFIEPFNLTSDERYANLDVMMPVRRFSSIGFSLDWPSSMLQKYSLFTD